MADDGQGEARTRPGVDAIAPAEAMAGADPADLLLGLPELDGEDVLAMAAEISSAQRRARGRPAGATNRKNADMIAYLAARGHRDPWVTLSMLQSADFTALCRMVGADTTKARLAVLNVQRQSAEALMNYHHAKKPQQLDLGELGGSRRPVMVIGEMNVTQIGEATFMSAGIAPDDEKANEINGDVVRINEANPHENDKPLNTLDNPGESD